MNFTSPLFLIFYPAVLLLYCKIKAKYRKTLLIAASWFFYIAGGGLKDGFVLLFITLISWYGAWKISKTPDIKLKKKILIAVITVCVSCLIVFKIGELTAAGVSFYIFQAMSYVFDVYRGRLKYEENLGCYSLYLSFFPQLVAGPIERADKLLPSLKRCALPEKRDLVSGLWLMLRGFFKKTAIADYMALFADKGFESPYQFDGIIVILSALMFAVQIYCDFSGYTDIARGAAKMLGIELSENFDRPYRSENIREFWHRWHKSLTNWFTDYVYIPLGGGRKGLPRRCLNTMIVFSLSGLWHGLSANYLVWGALHGLLMVGYNIYSAYGKHWEKSKIKRVLSRLGTFSFVVISWIFFRAENLGCAFNMISALILNPFGSGINGAFAFLGIELVDFIHIAAVIAVLIMLERLPVSFPDFRRDRAFSALVCFLMLNAVILSMLSVYAENGGNAFIYFRF